MRVGTEAGFALTGFGDEISPDLSVQLDVLAAEGIRHLELRSIWDKNVLDLDADDVERALKELRSRAFAVSAIASPIGKVPLATDFAEYLGQFDKALQMAQIFGAPYVRIFSFYVPQGDVASYRKEVVHRLSVFAERAQAAGVILLHENERDIYGETPARCLEIVRGVNSPALRLAFDPANFVQVGISPMEEAYPILHDDVAYVHIKDAVFSDGGIRLPGQGDGGIPQLLAALRGRGFRGFLSMEPHQLVAGRNSGFSGPGPFATAARALKGILRSLGE